MVLRLQQGVEALAIQGDVCSEEDAQRAVSEIVEKWGKLDSLVNSASGNFLAAAEQLKPEGLQNSGYLCIGSLRFVLHIVLQRAYLRHWENSQLVKGLGLCFGD